MSKKAHKTKQQANVRKVGDKTSYSERLSSYSPEYDAKKIRYYDNQQKAISKQNINKPALANVKLSSIPYDISALKQPPLLMKKQLDDSRSFKKGYDNTLKSMDEIKIGSPELFPFVSVKDIKEVEIISGFHKQK